jgi:hypothetical protein
MGANTRSRTPLLVGIVLLAATPAVPGSELGRPGSVLRFPGRRGSVLVG